MRLDQLTLAIDLALLGLGLALTGALVHWHGWLAHTFGILLIVIGAVLCLVDGVRLLGWRTLIWPRSLRLDEQGISDDTKKGRGFRVDWADLKALGVIDDSARPGLLLVFFPQTRRPDLSPYAGFAPADWPQPVASPIPRRTGVVEAIVAGTPANWQKHENGPGWAALIVAPGERAEAIPSPRPARPQQRIDVGTELAWQALVGGALAGLLGVLAYLAAFDVLAATGATATFLLVGTPFLLIGLATLLSIPVVVRRRWVVIDEEAFTWADPAGTSFTIGWNELASASLEIVTVPSASLSRHAVHLCLVPADETEFAARHPELSRNDGRYVLRLGDVVGPAKAIAAACQNSAPSGLWQGVAERTGTLGIT
ncbi:hypothetical protein EV138_2943 [Kribbella voronezhensis]|uniref:Uncharacterized protein n=2 Tax=Kribbella voronezhensis TaxID=2512212 RepID=A0A4R7TDE3_9ACTN|nr:hypothetical protein EV138_2943 [Kribbella voronezhensis]